MKKSKFYFIAAFSLFFCNLTAEKLDVNFTGNCNNSSGLNSSQTLAQSFTAGLTGPLSSVKIGISTGSCTLTNTMNCVAKIYWGECTNSLLATENFSIPTGTSLTMYQINFSSPTYIIAGNVYTLQISVLPNQPCINDQMYGLREVSGSWHLENADNCGGSYAGGTAYSANCTALSYDFYIQTYVFSYSDVETAKINKELKVYPNPTKGNLKVDLCNIYSETVCKLYNLTGQLLQTDVFNNTQLINLEIKANPGVYLLTVSTGNKTQYIRLIKE